MKYMIHKHDTIHFPYCMPNINVKYKHKYNVANQIRIYNIHDLLPRKNTTRFLQRNEFIETSSYFCVRWNWWNHRFSELKPTEMAVLWILGYKDMFSSLRFICLLKCQTFSGIFVQHYKNRL